MSFIDIMQQVGRPGLYATSRGILCEWRPSPDLPAELEDLLYIFRISHDGDKVTYYSAPVGQGSTNLYFPVRWGTYQSEVLLSFSWLREMWSRLRPIDQISIMVTEYSEWMLSKLQKAILCLV